MQYAVWIYVHVSVWNPITGLTISESRGPTLTSPLQRQHQHHQARRHAQLPYQTLHFLIIYFFAIVTTITIITIVTVIITLYHLLPPFRGVRAGYAEIRGSFFYLFAIPFRQCHSFTSLFTPS